METFEQWWKSDGYCHEGRSYAAEKAWEACEKQWKDKIAELCDFIDQTRSAELSSAYILMNVYDKLRELSPNSKNDNT